MIPVVRGLRVLGAGANCRGYWNPSVGKLDLPAPAWKRVVAQAREDYIRQGWAHIPNFLDKAKCGEMCQEVKDAVSTGNCFFSSESHTIYQEEHDHAMPPEHIRNYQVQSSKCIVDYARVPKSSQLRSIYPNPRQRICNPDLDSTLSPSPCRLLDLIEKTTAVPTLHLSSCDYNAAYFNEFRDGDGLGWHFDRSEFGVNLVLQSPGEGGHFEYHRDTRSEADLHSFEESDKVLREGSEHPDVDIVDTLDVGSLCIFSGRLAMHRVTPIQGSPSRINAILTYEKEPGQKPNTYSLQKFFGR